MERLWSGDVKIKYPKQWIVMVNLQDDKTTHKTIGDVYFITSNKDEAYSTAIALGNSMGKRMIVEGVDDTPQIGGLELWNL
ncbi:MAG: hypothetical protein FWH14_01995 [Oscillospiraceae bacterium]|nr:hypothetical protein [Oscillospiraceae bacterium]